MKRATDVYIIVLLFCAAGLWMILSFGATQVAPRDLAGKWVLSEESGKPASIGPSMMVEQSGRFFQIAFEGGPLLKLKLLGQVANEQNSIDSEKLQFAGGPWELSMEGLVRGDEMIMHLSGPQQGVWSAHRVNRTYPANTAKSGGAR